MANSNYEIRIKVIGEDAGASRVFKDLEAILRQTATASGKASRGISVFSRASRALRGILSTTTSPLRKFSRALGNIAQITAGIMMARALQTAGQAIYDFGKSALVATADFQHFSIALEGLMAHDLVKEGKYDTIAAAMEEARIAAAKYNREIMRVAAVSPYQLENVRLTFRQAEAYGFAGQQALDFTNGILTLASGIGANNDMMQRMSYNLAQLKYQNRVTALDVRQLAMAGLDLVDVLKFVGKQHGVTVENIKDFNDAIVQGKISWDDFASDFKKYAETNFGNASYRMSRTLKGLWSTFKDVFEIGMPKLLGGAAEHFADFAGNILDNVMGFMNSDKIAKAGEMVTAFAEDMFGRLEAMRQTAKRINVFGSIGVSKVDIAKILGIDEDQAAEITPVVRRVIDALGKAGKAINTGFVAGASRVPEVLAAMNAGFEKVKRAVQWVVDAFTPLATAIWDFVSVIWEGLAPAFAQIKQAFVDAFGEGGGFGDNVKRVLLAIANVIEYIIPYISILAEAVGGMLAGAFKVAFEVVAAVVSLFAGDFDAVLKHLGEALVGLGQIVLNALKGVLDFLIQFIGRIFGVSDAKISAFTAQVHAAFISLWVKTVEIFTNIHDRIVEKFGSIQEFLKAAVKAMIDIFIKHDWLSAYTNFVEPLYDAFSDVFDRIGEAVNNFVSNIGNKIRSALNGITMPNFNFSFSGFGGERAEGGTVQAYKPYIVGEREPELFFPRMSGTIVPMSKLRPGQSGNNITINVNGAQDPEAVANAIMARLVMQGL